MAEEAIKVTEVCVIQDIHTTAFQDAINDKLDQGWRLRGDMIAFNLSGGTGDAQRTYVQMLVKK